MNDFSTQWSGRFEGLLKWQDFDDFWSLLIETNSADWYIYAIGESVPTNTTAAEITIRFLTETATLLKKEHDKNYCGIVYVDDKINPTMVKIFDPNNLGVSCGHSENSPLPAWMISKIPPLELGKNIMTTRKNQR